MRAKSVQITLSCVLAWITLHSQEADAAPGKLKQTTAGTPPAEIQPAPTNTGHEVGFGLHFNTNPDVFLPRPRYRYTFVKTAVQGPLSGFWLEAGIGPGVGFNGGVIGNAALILGYEFDPFSNLALTFSPTIHNEFDFTSSFFGFMQTYGGVMRLYVKGHWVVYLEPFSFGWFASGSGAIFAYQAGFGFGYRF